MERRRAAAPTERSGRPDEEYLAGRPRVPESRQPRAVPKWARMNRFERSWWGRRTARKGDEWSKTLEHGGPHPFHFPQRLDRAVGPEGIPVGDDPVGQRRPDAWERLDLALGGVIQIDGCGLRSGGSRPLRTVFSWTDRLPRKSVSIRGSGGADPSVFSPPAGCPGGAPSGTPTTPPISRGPAPFFGRASRMPRRLAPFWVAAADSAAVACRARACCSSGVDTGGAPARTARTAPPRRTTIATNASAFCSEGVGTGGSCHYQRTDRHRFRAVRPIRVHRVTMPGYRMSNHG